MSIISDIAGATNPVSAIASIASSVESIVDHIFPDATAAQKQAFILKLTDIQAQVQSEHDQALINLSASGHLFEGGWRALIGWGGALALIFHYTVIPLVTFIFDSIGHPIPNLPDLGINELMPLIIAMLGIHGSNVYNSIKSNS